MVSPEEDAKYVGENVGKSQSGISKLEISILSTSGKTCAPLGISTKVGVAGVIPVSYTHLTLPTSELV